MDLCFGGCVLLAGLFLSVSALTPEECHPLIAPLSLANNSRIYGEFKTLAGSVDHEVLNKILKVTHSSWIRFSESESNPNEVVMFEANKMNGKCYESRIKMTIDGNVARMRLTNWTSEFQLLSSADGCLAILGNNTVSHIEPFLRLLNISKTFDDDKEFHARGFYLMCKEVTLTEADLEHFKKQAGCLGFSRELNFRYDEANELCTEGGGAHLDF
ncbi:uncharacterized protein [Brachionichthys hirsutus]|uniref:uncharacterized protein n=1 Tax=Brachionichthys hirsutus TaxID=412623 RepID=UPI0036053584